MRLRKKLGEAIKARRGMNHSLSHPLHDIGLSQIKDAGKQEKEESFNQGNSRDHLQLAHEQQQILMKEQR